MVEVVEKFGPHMDGLLYTVEPLNKGHVGTSLVLYREVSCIRRLICTGIIGIGTSRFVRVLYLECLLPEIPLYTL